MRGTLLLSAGMLASAALCPLQARSDGTAVATSATPPPQIYHIVTTALCARLHGTVRPAVAMVLENDQAIAKSPPLFAKYLRGTTEAMGAGPANANGDPPSGDSIYTQSPATNMALQQMSYLVLPIARNIIAAQTLLDDPKLLATTGSAADDATLSQVKQQLLQTIAYQSASLDLINGFVQTIQMGELQHVGEEYLGAIQGGGTGPSGITQATPNPWQDTNTPGLKPNPYAFDVTQVPGLAVGYNPIRSITDGLAWLRAQTKQHEDSAGSTIMKALSQCGR